MQPYLNLKDVIRKYVTRPLAIAGIAGALSWGNLSYGNRFCRDDIAVNTYKEGWQGRPDAAMDEKGDVIITWDSLYQDGSWLGIYAQRFDRELNKVGD